MIEKLWRKLHKITDQLFYVVVTTDSAYVCKGMSKEEGMVRIQEAFGSAALKTLDTIVMAKTHAEAIHLAQSSGRGILDVTVSRN